MNNLFELIVFVSIIVTAIRISFLPPSPSERFLAPRQQDASTSLDPKRPHAPR